MEKELISVIVPVYNIENYVEECLQSIVEQTYKNLEIIVVDDGSKDSSGKICDEFAQKDTRINVYHTPNGGLSCARNFGIEHSHGYWITFIDGDDTIDTSFFEKLINKSSYKDFVACRSVKDYPDGTSSIYYETTLADFCISPYKFQHFIHDTIHQEKNGVFTTDCIFNTVCRYLLKKEIIEQNKLRFVPGMKYVEDVCFMTQYMALCQSGDLVDEYLYHYRMVDSSITHKQAYDPNLFNIRKTLLETQKKALSSVERLSEKEKNYLILTVTAKLWWSVCSHEAYLNPDYKKQLNYYRKHGGVENPISFKFLFYLKKQKYSIKRIAMFALIKFKMWGLFKKFLR